MPPVSWSRHNPDDVCKYPPHSGFFMRTVLRLMKEKKVRVFANCVACGSKDAPYGWRLYPGDINSPVFWYCRNHKDGQDVPF